MKYKMFILSAACLVSSCLIIKVNKELVDSRENEFHLNRGSEISFHNSKGDLELEEWESDFILIETSIYGDSAHGVPEGLNIRFDQSTDDLSVVVDYPGRAIFCSVDFLVKIPTEMDYTINQTTTNGETLIIADVFANVETTNGDIYVEVRSSHSLETTNGDITALLYGQNEEVVIETTNGNVSVELPDFMGFDTETVNGVVVIDGVETDDEMFLDGDWIARIETTNGDIHIQRNRTF